MNVLNIVAIFAVVECLLSLWAGPARAEGNIHIGKLRIHPFLSVSDTFSDNIFYTSSEPKRDSIITYTPGVKLLFPFSENQMTAEYFAVMNRYSTYSGEDTTDHHASGTADFKFGRLFEARLTDVFLKGHEPRSVSATGFIEPFRNNTGTISLSYHLADRSKVQLDAGKSFWNFPDSPFRDRDERLYAGYLYYRFLPKTSAFIEFDRKEVSFLDSSTGFDNRADSALLGLTWEMSEKSKGTIKAGRLWKDFENPSARDFNGWIGSVDFNHAFSDDVALTLLAERTVNETNLLTTYYYLTTGAYAEFSYRFFRKLTAMVRGSYGTDSFSDVAPGPVAREDRTTTTGTGLKYSISDWLDIDFGYNRRIRRSNIPVNDYNEHSYVISASVFL